MARPRGNERSSVSTATRILDVAEDLVQRRGFNGFSYADVARELRITKASLHYHFPEKADLGRALIERYAARFMEALAGIADVGEAPARLKAYTELYGAVLRESRMCLCGMLAAEYATLPEPMREAVTEFFERNEAWLSIVLEDGARTGSLAFSGSARDAARMLVSGLEGAMLVARPYGDSTRFDSTAGQLLASMTVAAQPA